MSDQNNIIHVLKKMSFAKLNGTTLCLNSVSVSVSVVQ